MKKLATAFQLIVLFAIPSLIFAQNDSIVITEISYNPPESGTDSTEFIELYNAGSTTIDLDGYNFTQGVTHTFSSYMLSPGEYFVVAVDSVAIGNVYGTNADAQWTSGGLNNGGEDIILKDKLGNTIDSLDYDNNSPWPVGPPDPDGSGPSIRLCDPLSDNADPANWDISTDTVIGQIINTYQVYGSPGFSSTIITNETITACDSLQWRNGITYTTNNNTAIDTVFNAFGCDSIFKLDLTIVNIDTSVVNSGDSITSNAVNASYQWIDCDNSTPLAGETGKTFVAKSNGDYAVEITENGCVDTSACTNITIVQIIENSLKNSFKLYPNPTNGRTFIEFDKSVEEIHLKVMSITGQVLEVKEATHSNKIDFEINGSRGIYFIEISDENNQTAVLKLIKK